MAVSICSVSFCSAFVCVCVWLCYDNLHTICHQTVNLIWPIFIYFLRLLAWLKYSVLHDLLLMQWFSSYLQERFFKFLLKDVKKQILINVPNTILVCLSHLSFGQTKSSVNLLWCENITSLHAAFRGCAGAHFPEKWQID